MLSVQRVLLACCAQLLQLPSPAYATTYDLETSNSGIDGMSMPIGGFRDFGKILAGAESIYWGIVSNHYDHTLALCTSGVWRPLDESFNVGGHSNLDAMSVLALDSCLIRVMAPTALTISLDTYSYRTDTFGACAHREFVFSYSSTSAAKEPTHISRLSLQVIGNALLLQVVDSFGGADIFRIGTLQGTSIELMPSGALLHGTSLWSAERLSESGSRVHQLGESVGLFHSLVAQNEQAWLTIEENGTQMVVIERARSRFQMQFGPEAFAACGQDLLLIDSVAQDKVVVAYAQVSPRLPLDWSTLSVQLPPDSVLEPSYATLSTPPIAGEGGCFCIALWLYHAGEGDPELWVLRVTPETTEHSWVKLLSAEQVQDVGWHSRMEFLEVDRIGFTLGLASGASIQAWKWGVQGVESWVLGRML